jgi:hypothetical protein
MPKNRDEAFSSLILGIPEHTRQARHLDLNHKGDCLRIGRLIKSYFDLLDKVLISGLFDGGYW